MSPYVTTLKSSSFTSGYCVCRVIIVIKHPFWGIQNLYVPQMPTGPGDKGVTFFLPLPATCHNGMKVLEDLGSAPCSDIPQPKSILAPLCSKSPMAFVPHQENRDKLTLGKPLVLQALMQALLWCPWIFFAQ